MNKQLTVKFYNAIKVFGAQMRETIARQKNEATELYCRIFQCYNVTFGEHQGQIDSSSPRIQGKHRVFQ